MNHKNTKTIWLYLIMTALVLSAMIGCTSRSDIGSTEPVSSQLEYSTNIPTAMPTAKITLTLPTTITSLPTLTTEQALAKIRELFRTNDGCQLPCLWGITPGVSASNPVFNFIQSIAVQDDLLRNGKDLSDSIVFYSDLPEDMQYLGKSTLHGKIDAKNGIIKQIYVEGFEWPSYHLAPFLFENGKPNEVWITTYRLSDPNSSVTFIVSLLYSERGIMVSYSGVGEQQEGKIVGCVDRSLSYLVTWDPDKELSFVEANALIRRDISKINYKPLVDVTEGEMDIEQFYEKFRVSEEVPCIDTSANLWQFND